MYAGLGSGLRKVGQGIRRHKVLFILTLLLQMIFAVTLVYVTIVYQVKIFDTVQQIIQPMQSIDYTAEAATQNQQELLSQVAGIYQAYKILLRQLIELAWWWLGLFLILNGSLWVLSHRVVEDSRWDWKRFARCWLRLVLATIAIFTPFLALAYFAVTSIIRVQLDPQQFGQMLKYLPYLLGIIYYFLLNAFAAIDAHSWKEMARRFWLTAARKIHHTLPVLAVIIGGIAIPTYLIYYFMELNSNFTLMIASTILLMTMLVLGRLCWIACLHEISAPEKHHETTERNNP